MCWQASVSSGTARSLQVNSNNYWMSVAEPRFSDNRMSTALSLSERFYTFDMSSTSLSAFLPGDVFRFYTESTYEDCYTPSVKGSQMRFFNLRPNGIPFFPPMWFGHSTGITGVTTGENVLHVCYHSLADDSEFEGYRLTKADGSPYDGVVSNFNVNFNLPEVSSFFVNYGGTVNSSVNASIWFHPYGSITRNNFSSA